MSSSGITFNINISDSSIKEYFEGYAKVETAKKSTRMADVLLEVINVYKSSGSKCPVVGKSSCSENIMNLLMSSFKGSVNENKGLFKDFLNVKDDITKTSSEESKPEQVENTQNDEIKDVSKEENVQDALEHVETKKEEGTKPSILSQKMMTEVGNFIPAIEKVIGNTCSILGNDKKNIMSDTLSKILSSVHLNQSEMSSVMESFNVFCNGLTELVSLAESEEKTKCEDANGEVQKGESVVALDKVLSSIETLIPGLEKSVETIRSTLKNDDTTVSGDTVAEMNESNTHPIPDDMD